MARISRKFCSGSFSFAMRPAFLEMMPKWPSVNRQTRFDREANHNLTMRCHRMIPSFLTTIVLIWAVFAIAANGFSGPQSADSSTDAGAVSSKADGELAGTAWQLAEIVSIIEFEPLDIPLAATVLGEEVRTSDPGEMQEIVLTRLFDSYAEEQGIEVTDGEIDTYVDNMSRGKRDEGLTAEDDLSPGDAAQLEQMRRKMGRLMIRQWKLNRALHRQYGGRIIFQQLGPEPLDAYRKYLEERQVAGDFAIHRKNFENAFWRYFTDDSIHNFYEPGSEEEARAFTTPPWEQTAASGGEKILQPASGFDVPAAPDDGGPINWEVSGVTGGLNLRGRPSTSAQILATYASGTVFDNLGCQRAEDRIWCTVQPFGGGPVGYVAADYLRPAAAPDGSVPMGPDISSLRAGRGDFDATGKIPCAQHPEKPMMQCNFGVARQSGGFATLVVTKPDGMKRAIFFRRGVPTSADTSEADGYGEFGYDKEGGLNLIRVGGERYEIPDVLVLGGQKNRR